MSLDIMIVGIILLLAAIAVRDAGAQSFNHLGRENVFVFCPTADLFFG